MASSKIHVTKLYAIVKHTHCMFFIHSILWVCIYTHARAHTAFAFTFFSSFVLRKAFSTLSTIYFTFTLTLRVILPFSSSITSLFDYSPFIISYSHASSKPPLTIHSNILTSKQPKHPHLYSSPIKKKGINEKQKQKEIHY